MAFKINKKGKSPFDTTEWKQVIEATIEAVVRQKFSEIEADVTEEIETLFNDFEDRANILVSKTLKGDKGNTPKVGIDFEQPKNGITPVKGKDYFDGKNYVLKESDKSEIASKIKPQIVEKVIEHTVHEIPIVREVALRDEPKQIADKLNTLKQVVKQDVIIGLENRLRTIDIIAKNALQKAREKSKSNGGGGGGMGNVQHETKSVNFGTVSVTTTYPIANNGRAIFSFSYENATLELTNHYTVGTDRKTITFDDDIRNSFTDNTTVYISYARG